MVEKNRNYPKKWSGRDDMFFRFCWRNIRSIVSIGSNLFCLIRSPIFKGKEMSFGNGRPVLLIPGFIFGDFPLMVMRFWLKRTGFKVFLSGSVVSFGCPYKKAQQLEKKLSDIYGRTNQPVVLIGYSLGGVTARFLAGKYPGKIRHIFTLGSPSVSGTKVNPFFFRLFTWLNRGCLDSCDCEMTKLLMADKPIPESLIYSEEDEIVLRDSPPKNVPAENCCRVYGSHLALTVNPDVYRAIALRLNKL